MLSKEDREVYLSKYAELKAEKEKPSMLEIELLESFPNHRFSLYVGQRLDDMVSSIKEYGVLTPLIIWRNNNRNIILSGHNRKNAAKLAGLTSVPVIILENLSDEEAALIVSETNLRQRSFSDMAYSERAYCLADHYNALKKQGKRIDLLEQIKKAEFPDNEAENSTSPINGTKEKSEKTVAEKYNLAHGTVAQYIRVATINKELMSMLDANQIAFNAAYQLSFITSSATQQLVANVIKSIGNKLSPAKATELRKFWTQKKEMTEKDISEILNGEKKSVKMKAVIKSKILEKYFPSGTSEKEIIQKIITLLEADKEANNG